MWKGSGVRVSLSRKDRPLYLQIKHIIKDRILHGEYALGSNIPSEPLLEREFGVSKITVRGAIQELVQEGYLEKGSGRGTKVIRNKAASKLSKWKHFTEILVESGHWIKKEWLRAETVRNAAGTEPHRLFGERCLKLERVYYLDDAPYIYYVHYLPAELESALTLSELKGQSLYELLEEQGIVFGKLQDEFGVALAPPEARAVLGLGGGALAGASEASESAELEESRATGILGTPLLKRSRYSRDEQGGIIEYSVGYYNTELQNYIVNYDV
ncbi:GntR family transcriptional regulator [Paenibacillus sp. M1]|uniref:GntR family transcriptional regulator n=1 Tax=Paenibacillus haidiansis TaxID=1574488 RepID=A0ABU7VM97_9BACL